MTITEKESGWIQVPHKPVNVLPRITNHALVRYLQLSGKLGKSGRNVFTKAGNVKTPERVTKAIWTDIANSEPVRLKKKFQAKQLLNHDCRPATYLRNKRGWIFVMEDNHVVTVHNGAAKRWE